MGFYNSDIFINQFNHPNDRYLTLTETANIYQVFSEAYYGKTKKLLDAEALIHQIREKYHIGYGINTKPEVMAFNRLMEEIFGFDTFCLDIRVGSGLQNACTIPIGYAIGSGNPSKHIIKTSTSFKYDKQVRYSVMTTINSGLMFSPKFTDAEIMAIILHEIGHNFQTAASGSSRCFSYVVQVMSLITLPLQILVNPAGGLQLTMPTRKALLNWVEDMKKNHPDACEAFDTVCGTIRTIGGVAFTVVDIISNAVALTQPWLVFQGLVKKIISQIQGILINPMKILQIIFGRNDERLADAFPTMYGYGADITSALRKMKDFDNGMISKNVWRNHGISFIGNYFDFLTLPEKLISGLLDPHPEIIFRARDQLVMLQKELRSEDLDPKAKKAIEAEIAIVKKEIDKLCDKTQQGFLFTNATSQAMFVLTGGDMSGVGIKTMKCYDKMLEKAAKE